MSEPAPGTTAPLHVAARVCARERVGAYHVLSLSAPGVAERFYPGQFVALAVGGQRSAMLARRAFSVCEAIPGDPPDGPGGAVSVVFAVHGGGTAWLAGLRPDDPVDIVGPLGRPFTPAREGARCVLVGGGYGSAPLFSLATTLVQRGCRVDMVLGAASAERVFGVARARSLAHSLTVTTEDGSLGERGVVTDVLSRLLLAGSRGPRGPRYHATLGGPAAMGGGNGQEPGEEAAVYACGPMPMLARVSAFASERGVPVQVAVEESMACGIGVCMTCVLPVAGDDGRTRLTRSCVEGPVFAGGAVRWNDIGTIPVDAVGA